MPPARLANAEVGQRVLVTGHRGYIGSVLAPHLVDLGHEVVGLDTDFFGDCRLGPEPSAVPWHRRDIRDVTPADLDGFDAVIHLAALSNDPIGNLRDDWTNDINLAGSVRLAAIARKVGVARFVFSSSCIMYGLSDGVATEDSPLDPKSTYARSKVAAEQAIGLLADDRFSPVFLRNGTVYGLSPAMRLDTVFNDLVAAALADHRITVRSDGTPWRPVVHVNDVAAAFARVLDAPREVVHKQAFNVGAEHINYQVIDLARAAAATVSGCQIEVLASPDADQRSYRAGFGKWARTFPDVTFRRDAVLSAMQLHDGLEALGFGSDDYHGPRYVRLRWLNRLLAAGLVDDRLRWALPGARD